jgi:hypothetical protein
VPTLLVNLKKKKLLLKICTWHWQRPLKKTVIPLSQTVNLYNMKEHRNVICRLVDNLLHCPVAGSGTPKPWK